MAMAVPLLMGAMGASTMAIAITSVAFAVTGINDKINKVAANVFGEDLVKFANVAGMAFGAYQAWSAPTGGADLATSDAWSSGAGLGQDTVSAVGGNVPAADAFSSTALPEVSSDVVSRMAGFEPVGGFDSATSDAWSTGSPGLGRDTMSAVGGNAPALQTAAPVVSTPPPSVTGTPVAQSPNATTSAAGGASVLKAEGATNLNVMDRIKNSIINPKTGDISQGAMTLGGMALKGGADAYSAAKAREVAQEQFDRKWNLAERNAAAVGWRQTK